MAVQACYRKLSKYKYQLVRDYPYPDPVATTPASYVDTSFIRLTTAGQLTIKTYYAWDGASSAIDTKSTMRASLVHDALYQLMRAGDLDYNTQREAADDLYRQIALDDGMWKVRAWAHYRALRWRGEKNAKPTSTPATKEICVP